MRLLLVGRHLDDAAEGGDLVAGDRRRRERAILAASATRPVVKTSSARRRTEGRALAIDQHMAGERAEQRAERAAQHEPMPAAAERPQKVEAIKRDIP